MDLKKTIIIAASGLLLTSFAVYAADGVGIYVNGNLISQTGYLDNGTTYVPLRAVSEALGASVEWDGSNAHINMSEDTLVADIAAEVSESVVAVVGNYVGSGSGIASEYNETTAHGTGVVIKSNGTILTNAHVAEDIENITVIFNDGTSYGAYVQCIDTEADLATIKISKLGLKPVTFADPASVQTGNTVIAIGTPLSLNMRNSTTKGIISGTDVRVKDAMYPLIQTDAAINSGNSGGPLVNMRGEVVGINSSKYSGLGVEGMAFSIPTDTINYVLGQFEKNGKVLRPDIGVGFDESWEARIGLPTSNGITVKNSTSSELMNGDVVTAVNGIAVHSIIDYNKAVRDTFTDTISVTFTRNGQEMTVSASYELK